MWVFRKIRSFFLPTSWGNVFFLNLFLYVLTIPETLLKYLSFLSAVQNQAKIIVIWKICTDKTESKKNNVILFTEYLNDLEKKTQDHYFCIVFLYCIFSFPQKICFNGTAIEDTL